VLPDDQRPLFLTGAAPKKGKAEGDFFVLASLVSP